MADHSLENSSSPLNFTSMFPYSNTAVRSRVVIGWCVWSLTASSGIVSSKYLLFKRNYHYPLHLLLSHLFLAALGSTCRLVHCRGRYSVAFTAPQWQFIRKSKKLKGPFQLAGIACAAASLPLAMQALLHFLNPATLCVVTVAALIMDALLLSTLTGTKLSTKTTVSCGLALLSCALVLYDEYRLSVNGLLFGIPAILLAGAAKALFHYDDIRNDLRTNNSNAGLNFTFQLMIWTSAVITIVWSVFVEGFWGAISDLLKVNPLWIVFNILCSAAGLVSGGSLLYRLPVHPPSSGGKRSSGGKSTSRSCSRSSAVIPSGLFLFMNVCMVGLFSTLLISRTHISIVQFPAFLVSLFCAGSVALAVYRAVDDDGLDDTQHEMLLNSHTIEQAEPRLPALNYSKGLYERWKDELGDGPAIGLALSVLVLAAGCFFAWGSISLGLVGGSRVGNLPAHLDTKFEPQSDIDIVVSMFREPLHHLNTVLDSVRKTPAFAAAKIQRLIIYTKDPDADLSYIKGTTNASRVSQIKNIGREGETYLRHILQSWDDLAKHTMFIQADIHNPREFLPRIRNYFDPEKTGMLSLGFSGNVCDCDDCGDRFSWHDETKFISSLYKDVYQTEQNCSRALLSYKGQFIASARRIRGVKKKVYENIWHALVDEDIWAHREDYPKGKEDNMSAPSFGYTVERLWSVLFQCNDMEIAWKCPTLLGGWRRGGSPEDCQCFDEVEVIPED